MLSHTCPVQSALIFEVSEIHRLSDNFIQSMFGMKTEQHDQRELTGFYR